MEITHILKLNYMKHPKSDDSYIYCIIYHIMMMYPATISIQLKTFNNHCVALWVVIMIQYWNNPIAAYTNALIAVM